MKGGRLEKDGKGLETMKIAGGKKKKEGYRGIERGPEDTPKKNRQRRPSFRTAGKRRASKNAPKEGRLKKKKKNERGEKTEGGTF